MFISNKRFGKVLKNLRKCHVLNSEKRVLLFLFLKEKNLVMKESILKMKGEFYLLVELIVKCAFSLATAEFEILILINWYFVFDKAWMVLPTPNTVLIMFPRKLMLARALGHVMLVACLKS